MTPRQGPSKKLAPTLTPGTVCPHEYVDDEGLRLEIDCSSCKGAHDLRNPKCMSAVIGVLVDGAVPEAIILKRFIHKRYRSDLVITAARASEELASLNRAIASTPVPSDRRCRTCPAGRAQVLLTKRVLLLEEPSAYLRGCAGGGSRFRTLVPNVDCAERERCLNEAFGATRGRR